MAQTFPKVGVPLEARKRRERKWQEWQRHPDALRLIREQIVPKKWVSPLKLHDCRTQYVARVALDDPELWSVKTSFACHQIPWCIPDTKIGVWKRVRAAEKRIRVWTPPEQEPRTIHAVFQAPLTVDGQGWGAKAMQNIGEFFRVVDGTLRDVFGAKIGWQGSYQDFGEIPFTKSIPHIDLTLNGWKIEDGQILPLEFDPTHDKTRVNEAYAARATAFGFDLADRPGNSWVGPPRRGMRAARGALVYQMRELVDLRKVRYPVGSNRVGWTNYKDGSVDWMQADRFADWYEAYEQRVKPHEANSIHRGVGYMARRMAGQALRLGFGGQAEPDHEDGCRCVPCHEWRSVVDEASLFPKAAGDVSRPVI